MGLGYAPPYLAAFREQAVRLLAFMPAEQGVVNWQGRDGNASALVDFGLCCRCPICASTACC